MLIRSLAFFLVYVIQLTKKYVLSVLSKPVIEHFNLIYD